MSTTPDLVVRWMEFPSMFDETPRAYAKAFCRETPTLLIVQRTEVVVTRGPKCGWPAGRLRFRKKNSSRVGGYSGSGWRLMVGEPTAAELAAVKDAQNGSRYRND